MRNKILWLTMAVFCCFSSAIASQKIRPAIVLGNYPADSITPADQQTARCLKAYELYADGKADTIIVSGGFTRGHISEARMMKIALATYGVPESAIVEEDRSATTVENSFFAKKIFEDKGWEKRALLVSQSYHLPRAKVVFQNDGFEIKNITANASSKKSDFENMPYEKAAIPEDFDGGAVIVYEPYASTEPMNYPSPGLAGRLRAAAAMYRNGKANKIILLSEWHTRGPVDIAEMMNVALVSLGVARSGIEMKSHVHYSKIETIKQVLPADMPVLIITSAAEKIKIEEELPGVRTAGID